jgi:Phage integrase, N-terminal SAM-like domain
MVKAQVEIEEGTHVKPSRLTLATFLAQWLEAIQEAVKPTTFINYRDYIEAYVLPHMGKRRLQEIDVPTINAFYRRLRDQGRRKKNTNGVRYAYYSSAAAGYATPACSGDWRWSARRSGRRASIPIWPLAS